MKLVNLVTEGIGASLRKSLTGARPEDLNDRHIWCFCLATLNLVTILLLNALYDLLCLGFFVNKSGK